MNDLVDFFNSEGESMLIRMKDSAWEAVKNLIVKVNSLDDLKSIINEGKVGIIPYCSIINGEECAIQLKADTGGGDVRGKLIEDEDKIFDVKDIPKENEICLACKKKAELYVYIGKQY